MPPSSRLIDPFELPHDLTDSEDFVFNLDVDPEDDDLESAEDSGDFS